MAGACNSTRIPDGSAVGRGEFLILGQRENVDLYDAEGLRVW